jgi:hypothetical protein
VVSTDQCIAFKPTLGQWKRAVRTSVAYRYGFARQCAVQCHVYAQQAAAYDVARDLRCQTSHVPAIADERGGVIGKPAELKMAGLIQLGDEFNDLVHMSDLLCM